MSSSVTLKLWSNYKNKRSKTFHRNVERSRDGMPKKLNLTVYNGRFDYGMAFSYHAAAAAAMCY